MLTAIALWPLLPKALALPSPEQMQAVNEALRTSEASHRANFVCAPVPLHILDTDGMIVEAPLSLTLDEVDETFSVDLSDAVGGPLWAGQTTATGTIVDDDPPPPPLSI